MVREFLALFTYEINISSVHWVYKIPVKVHMGHLAPGSGAYKIPDTKLICLWDTWHQVKVHMGHLAPGFGVSQIPGTK